MQVTVFIPAYNEAAKIATTVNAAWRIDGVNNIVVIDDGSTDDTRIQALIAGATVLRLEENTGKGGALMTALEDAHFDYCLFLDADLGKTAEQGVLLLAPVMAGELDMSIARFPSPAKKAGFGKVKGLASSAIAQVDPNFECHSPLSGQRAFSTKCIHSLLPLADGFGVEVALTIKALQQNWRIGEIPTLMQHSATGNDFAGMAHRLRQYKDVRRAVLELGLEV